MVRPAVSKTANPRSNRGLRASLLLEEWSSLAYGIGLENRRGVKASARSNRVSSAILMESWQNWQMHTVGSREG